KDGGTEGTMIISRLEVVEVGSDQQDKPITSCVVVPSDDVVASLPGGETLKLTGDLRLAYEALCEALIDFGEVGSSTVIPPKPRTVKLSGWTTIFSAGFFRMLSAQQTKLTHGTKKESPRILLDGDFRPLPDHAVMVFIDATAFGEKLPRRLGLVMRLASHLQHKQLMRLIVATAPQLLPPCFHSGREMSRW